MGVNKNMFKKKVIYNIKNCIQCPFSKNINQEEQCEDIYCNILKDIVAEHISYANEYGRTTSLSKCPLKTTDIGVIPAAL